MGTTSKLMGRESVRVGHQLQEGDRMTPSQIRDLRKALGLSLDEFAEKLGYEGKHRGYHVYRLETGKCVPDESTIKLMREMAEGLRRGDE
jgi:transcriptional regulator with XRE-family HTH domain